MINEVPGNIKELQLGSLYSKPISVNIVGFICWLLYFILLFHTFHTWQDGTISAVIHKKYFSLFPPPVMFAYEQCLLVLGHHPDIWYEAAQYLEQSSKLLAEKGVSRLTLVCFLISLR